MYSEKGRGVKIFFRKGGFKIFFWRRVGEDFMRGGSRFGHFIFNWIEWPNFCGF